MSHINVTIIGSVGLGLDKFFASARLGVWAIDNRVGRAQ
jgi:hypothetical protein